MADEYYLWTQGGSLVKDDEGNLLLCKTCPCAVSGEYIAVLSQRVVSTHSFECSTDSSCECKLDKVYKIAVSLRHEKMPYKLQSGEEQVGDPFNEGSSNEITSVKVKADIVSCRDLLGERFIGRTTNSGCKECDCPDGVYFYQLSQGARSVTYKLNPGECWISGTFPSSTPPALCDCSELKVSTKIRYSEYTCKKSDTNVFCASIDGESLSCAAVMYFPVFADSEILLWVDSYYGTTCVVTITLDIYDEEHLNILESVSKTITLTNAKVDIVPLFSIPTGGMSHGMTVDSELTGTTAGTFSEVKEKELINTDSFSFTGKLEAGFSCLTPVSDTVNTMTHTEETFDVAVGVDEQIIDNCFASYLRVVNTEARAIQV